MGTSTFRRNTEVWIDGRCLRLLRELEAQRWQLEDLKTGKLEEYSHSELLALYSRGALSFSNLSSDVRSASSEGLAVDKASRVHEDPQQWEAAKVRRAYVLAVLGVETDEHRFAQLIHEVWRKLAQPKAPPHWTTVYRWRKRYLEAGQDIYALTGRHHKKGNRKSRYPQEVLNLVDDAVERIYLTRERRTVQDVLDHVVTLVTTENDLRPAEIKLPVPSYRLVRSTIQKLPAFDVHAARYGRTAAVRRFRSVQHHRGANHPLERAEIDHTQLDLFVVDDKTGLPLGRPYVTACIDNYSRCVLGLHIGFDPPSYLTVAQCLKNAFLPKADAMQQYQGVKFPWESHGVMQELVVDNGMEFHSASLEALCYSNGIEIIYSPRRTPWFKGKIERFLRSFNDGIAHGVPGSTFSNVFEKDDYDPAKHAVVRWSTLQRVARMWVVNVYHQKPHRALEASPADTWARTIRKEDIFLPDSVSDLDVILGRVEYRTLTHKGVELYGLFYNSPELADLRRRLGARLRVELRVDEADLGQITVLAPDNTNYYSVKALDTSYARGLTLWQHKVCKHYSRRYLQDDDGIESWIRAKAEIQTIVEEEFSIKRRRSRSRMKRFLGGTNQSSAAAKSKSDTSGGTGSSQSATLPTPPVDTENQQTDEVSFSARSTGASRRRITPLLVKRAQEPFDDALREELPEDEWSSKPSR